MNKPNKPFALTEPAMENGSRVPARSDKVDADIDTVHKIVFDQIGNGIVVTDTDSRILLVNAAFSRITGYTLDEVRGEKTSVLKSGIHAADFYAEMWAQITAHGTWQGEITNRRKNGQLVSEWLSIATIADQDGATLYYMGTFSDLTEQRSNLLKIDHLTSYDTLTDLPNRNLFDDRLEQALNSAKRNGNCTAVMLLDLDRFRHVNDSLGAALGDQILKEVAQRLSQQLRPGDTVGRRSGNEFGCLMTNLAQDSDVIPLAQRLQETITAPFFIEDQVIHLSASIGVSIAPKDGNNGQELIRNADTSLLRAKQTECGTFRFYSPQMDANAIRRQSIETALRSALGNNEFTVFYQPQVSLDSGHMIGMEALLRWRSAQLGSVSPAEFIPVAEETGLIVPIGHWVLQTACEQAKTWLDIGFPPLLLAVNLSTRQFRHGKLVANIVEILENTGLPAELLELEITESAFMGDWEDALRVCREIKELGVKLSLDDFGTGYSSLAYVSRFPFDKLKIDQSFVRDITENPANAAIATATIVMGRSLNLSVLAEGVETDAQASFLRNRHCDALQGYLFSPPVAHSEFSKLLASNARLTLSGTTEFDQTLLIVDDEPSVLHALSRLFRRESYTVITAKSPSEAFNLLAQHNVRVILSDQRMPEMSGTEFFVRIKQLYPDTLRILLTGYTDLESITEAINRGAVYKFLTKPWDSEQLRECIREAFRISRGKQRKDLL